MTDNHDYLFKILVVGDVSTGKTSIIQRYVNGFFSSVYRATLGVDFALKIVEWSPNITLRLQLWDIAGQERFTNMTRVYYKEASAAFIVFDFNNISTYQNVKNWKNDIDVKVRLPNGNPLPIVLLANKYDLVVNGEGIVSKEELDKFCNEQGILAWFATSAKDDLGITDAANRLIKTVIESGQKDDQEQDPSTIKISTRQTPQNKKCC